MNLLEIKDQTIGIPRDQRSSWEVKDRTRESKDQSRKIRDQGGRSKIKPRDQRSTPNSCRYDVDVQAVVTRVARDSLIGGSTAEAIRPSAA